MVSPVSALPAPRRVTRASKIKRARTPAPTTLARAQTRTQPADFSQSTLAIDIRYQNVRPIAGLKAFLTKNLLAAASVAGVTDGQIDITLVNDALMSQLHLEHKNDATTTDVLTFDLRADRRSKSVVEVDLILCVDEARRQAALRGHWIERELLLYAVHGLLHLVGYDDTTAAKAARMHRREDEILQAIGIGPAFAVDPL
jgi:probable rRNA maturation factor